MNGHSVNRDRAKRVLVVRSDSVGDVLLCGPAVRAVAASAEVVLLAGPTGAPAARLLPGVAEVLQWNAPWIGNPPAAVTAESWDELVAMVRSAAVDEAVVLTSFHQSPLPMALALRLAGVERITAASVDYPGSLLDIRLRPGETLDEDQPETERALAIVAAAGFALSTDDDGRLAVELPEHRRLVDERYVVLHPGASAPSRTWPAERFAALADALHEQGLRVVVTGSRSEALLAQQVAGERGLDLSGDTDLATLGSILRGAELVVVGNTGPAHLAAAVGTPVVSLFAPVVPAIRWAPYGVPVELLGDQGAACAGSRATVCPVAGHPCLVGVSVEDALAACDRLLVLAGEAAR